MIKLFIIGNLGKDASVNNANGKSVINFSVAHTERYRDAQGTQKDKTTWAECSYWTDKTAIAPYLKKGTQVYVEGTPNVRPYTTQNGVNAASLTVRVSSVQLLGSKSGDSMSAGAPQENNMQSQHAPTADNSFGSFDDSTMSDDLPF